MSLLPPNATPFERALSTVSERMSDIPVPLRSLWNAATCPVELLPWLAWGLSIDSWSSDWPENVKRERVRQAIAIQRRKGTSASVRSVVRSFGGSVALREWWQLDQPGEPHTFELVLTVSGQDGQPATAAFIDSIIAEVSRTKPVRSHFTFLQGLASVGRVGLISVARPAIYARLSCLAPVK